VEGTSMSRIADEAELSKGAVYLYFPRKESIVYEILYEFLTDLKNDTAGVSAERGTGYEKAGRILQTLSAHYHQKEELLTLARYLDYRFPSSDDTVEEAERCISVLDDLKRMAAEVIHEGQKDGSIRDDLDPSLTSATIVHGVESFLLKFGTRERIESLDDGYEAKELVDHLLDLILYSLH
jgi:AcrR family transcriptional regulator